MCKKKKLTLFQATVWILQGLPFLLWLVYFNSKYYWFVNLGFKFEKATQELFAFQSFSTSIKKYKYIFKDINFFGQDGVTF